jgi:ADP-heptose:LPS heptosyltransferase
MAVPFHHEAVRSILLVKLRAIGDAVLTLPSLQALRQDFPQARITVLAPPASLGVYQDDPRCDELLAYDRGALRGLGAQAAFFASLRRRRPDLAVCLHASFRTALIGWMSGATWRSIRNHSGPDWFCNLPASEAKVPKSIIQRDFDALRALGLNPRDEGPRMAIPAAALVEAGKRWKAWRLKGSVVLLFPGAGKPEKRWPLEKFLALALALRRAKTGVLLLTAPGEPGLETQAKAVGAHWGSVSDLKVLGALCRLSGAVIGNDSGPRHIAAASGARTLTLFGPETLREWHPYAKEDGHWALQTDKGRVEDIPVGTVLASAALWMKQGAGRKPGRGRPR